MINRKAAILHIEDNPADVMLMELALAGCETKFDIHHLADGRTALDFLQQTGDNDAVRPDLILTDMDLPNVSGYDLVQFVQQHDSLKAIPVVVLSGLAYAESTLGHYQSTVACVLSKPMDGDGYADVARRIEEVWKESSANRCAE